MSKRIVIGTRGSALALKQAGLVQEALRENWSDLDIETEVIRTSGDEGQTIPQPVDAHAGRKGLFTSEIERALLDCEIDLAVHSAKDLPSDIHRGTHQAAVLPRASTDDVLLSTVPYDLQSFPRDGIVATGSVRRRHQLRWQRADIEMVDLRGNVPTRLRKLRNEDWHAIILARAGLERLGLNPINDAITFEDEQFATHVLPREVFVPAGGQGVIAMQIRSDDDALRMLLEKVNHVDTRLCLRAEREFLRLLQADCNQPIGVLAQIEGATMKLRGQIFEPGATSPREAVVEGASEDAEALAARLLSAIHGT
jgi:hydroxymethylbilane synthase